MYWTHSLYKDAIGSETEIHCIIMDNIISVTDDAQMIIR